MTASARPWADINSGVILAPIAAQHLGNAVIEPAGAFEAGSYASFTLTYTAGTYGIDDSGALRVCFRFATDQTPLQFADPTAPGYTTVEASNGAVLHYASTARPMSARGTARSTSRW
jgi:hypothetical protein